MKDKADRQNFEKEPHKDHLSQIWFSGFRGEDLNVDVYDVRRMPKANMAFGQVS